MIFSRNKFDARAEKLRLIHRIEGIQARLLPQGLQKVAVALDEVINLLDDKYASIHKEQIVLVDVFLSDMDAHLCKPYEAWLLKKCDHVTAVVRGECALDESSVTKIKNEDRLFEMLGELTLTDEQIKAVDRKMDMVLGTDKNLWNMLNAQRHTLTGRMMVINKNYRMLLESQSALSVASEVKKAKEEAEAIMRQAGMQDVVEFEENAEFTAMAAEDIRESTAKMHEVFDRTFGGTADSYEYERALEQKLMEKGTSAVRRHRTPAVGE